MKKSLPTRQMRKQPDLDQLRRQARELLEAYRVGEAAAVAEVNAHYRDADPADFALHQAHLALARAYGFESWPKLKAYVDGVTAAGLCEAVERGDLEAVRGMLGRRPEIVNLEWPQHGETTAIHVAVLRRNADIVRLLMQHGADARAGIWPRRSATAALRLATDRDFDEIAAIIREEEMHRPAEPEPETAGDPERPLSTAVREGSLQAVRELLDSGLDPDERERIEGTDAVSYSWGRPLYYAAALGRFDIAELLLQRAADANAQILACGTPVGRAYGAHNQDMVRLLESYGGVVYAANAGYYRDAELARRLFADEAEGRLRPGTIRPGTRLAEELLGPAATGGDPDIVRMCLERIDRPRDDPEWYWRLSDPLCFWNHMPGIETADPSLDRATYFECFRLILDRTHPNVGTYWQGTTVLHEVASMGPHVTGGEVAQFAAALLDAGAVLDRRDALLKSTPLGWAARYGRAELVKLLLDHGADPVEPDAEPWATPRAWAVKMGRDEIARLVGARVP